MMRFANGDVAGAERDLWQVSETASAGERDDLLLEAYEIAHAFLAHDPERAADAGCRAFLDRLRSEIAKSE